MNSKLRDEILRRQRRVHRRLQQDNVADRGAVMATSAARFETCARNIATSAGGVRLAHELARSVHLPKQIDKHVDLLKLHRPYHESDHVLSLAYNLLAGGTCIEDLEQSRTDEAFLNMLGVERLPDPTTSGDFCASPAAGEGVRLARFRQ